MNKQTIIVSALVVLGVVGLMLWGRTSAKQTPSDSNAKSKLAASETLFDFGTISMARGVVDHVFTVTNPTDRTINVGAMYTSCMCTRAYIQTAHGEKGPFGMQGMGYASSANESIGPGESRNVKVVYDPNAHGPAGVGSIDRLVYLTDSSGATLQLEIRANVIP